MKTTMKTHHTICGLISGLAFATTFVSLATTAQASLILVSNPSFEAPVLTDPWNSGDSAQPVTGWVQSASYAYNPYEQSGGAVWYVGAQPSTDPGNGGAGIAGIDGRQLGFVFESSPGSGFSQPLAATLQAGTAYTLTVTELMRNGAFAAPFLGSTIQLLAGSTVIASATDTVGPTSGYYADQIAFLANSDAVNPSLIGSALTIKLLTTNALTAAPSEFTDWDNVRLDATAVPEPTSAALLLGSGAMLLLRRRRASAL